MSDEQVTRRQFVRDGAAVAGLAVGVQAAQAADPATRPAAKPADAAKILNYNEKMEYRRCGKTNLMVSAIALGGHWKRIPYTVDSEDFRKNRHDVISACIDAGINYVDACTSEEVKAYGAALHGRRDKMYMAYSWYEHEMRFPEWQHTEKLLQSLDEGLRLAKVDYVDVWRITCYEPGSNHTPEQEDIAIAALEKAKKAGKCRFCGISSHHRDWLKRMIEKYPQLDVVLTPYTAGSKQKPTDSLFDAVKKQDVGLFGIKPFASGSVFRGRGAVQPATQKIDDERARLTLRYVLANDALTAPMPGLITVEQVKNAALAVAERRQFDQADVRRHEQAVKEMWANLPAEYEWLRNWEWV